jgi:hypothetical protein
MFPLYKEPAKKVGWVPRGRRVRLDPLLLPYLHAIVYRYSSFAEAFMLIGRGVWTFAKPSTWRDNYEKHVSKELFENTAVFADFPGYVKCVSFEYSSEAMWRTYSTSGGLVRMSWSLDNLIDLLDAADWGGDGKVYVGPVRYMEAPAIRVAVNTLKAAPKPEQRSQHAMRALMMKRSGFAFENEIRLCFFPSPNDPPAEPFHGASGFPHDTIRQVLIDPYLSSWQAREIQYVLKDVLRVPCDVEQSKFDTVYLPKA